MLIGTLQVIEDMQEPLTVHFKDGAFKNCKISSITDKTLHCYYEVKDPETETVEVVHLKCILLEECDSVMSTHKSNLLVVDKYYEEQ